MTLSLQLLFSSPQIALVTVTIISMSVAMPERPKLKFRPPGEWFENMQEPAEQSPSYFEQSDQPAESQFRDLFIEDDEPVAETQFTGGSKFARNHVTTAPAVFQSLCPTKRSDVVLSTDSFYEYRPSSYEVVTCKRLFHSSCDRNLNFSFPFQARIHMQRATHQGRRETKSARSSDTIAFKWSAPFF